ncbi:DNA repair protein [Pasteurella multocida]|uniref:DNA repair protein n=1 Tax=Pasteurella TaxID=745 RepID=UPI000E0133D0|nr:DNA repair protein [Pasteurella multocida]MCL7787275.1 DNA repair protein [Pasteurella multocida]MCL7794397.1 DNA repair protein [Pasteurella multocida]URI02485.1 DNA repair protein [Pasteurella multocida]SUB45969.1 Tellurite resistance protein TerB [Pasteurella multocida subsp. septica]HDR1285735.1 DNA repair protein [Pasteurella multocida]
MFIQNLNKEQQSAFLFLAQELIKADGTLEKAEVAILETLKQQTFPDTTEKEIALDKLPQVFNTKIATNSALLELIAIAHADEQYHENEKSLISTYAQAFNVNQDTLFLLETWVKKQIELSKEAMQLLNQ